ncbi:hypothetical protein AAVH_33839, partial [Aphelenchoides avenae]
MADCNVSPAQRGRGLLALNITNARRFLRSNSIKESRSIAVCGFNWKLKVDRRQMLIGSGRKKSSCSYLTTKISCTVSDAQRSTQVKAKCRLRVRHATANDLEKTWTNSLSFNADEDDGVEELGFAKDNWLDSIE